MAALFVRILISIMHNGKFLEPGDVVPSDSVLLDLAIGRTKHYLGNVCEVVDVPKAAAEPAPETEATAEVNGVEAEDLEPVETPDKPKRGRPAKAAEPAPETEA